MSDFYLGSIRGLEIRVDRSWLILGSLLLWALGVNVFPVNYPGLPHGVYGGMAVLAVFLVFASVLCHDLAEALVAQRQGIPTRGITLFAFGNLSLQSQALKQPRDEFHIAGIGLLVSSITAALFGLIAFSLLHWIAAPAFWAVAIAGIATYLAKLNLLLTGLYLLPGLPLEGGRLLRALVWQGTDNLAIATRIVTRASQWLAYCLIGLGLWRWWQFDFVGGLWFGVISWFLYTGAVVSYLQLMMQTNLQGVKAHQLMTCQSPLAMTPATVTARPDEDMTQVIQKMQITGLRQVLVTDNGKLEGVISTADVVHWLQLQENVVRN